MNLTRGRIIRLFVIFLVIGIIIFSTINSIVQVHNTHDPYYAKKIVLITTMIILASIVAGGFIIYLFREQKR